MTRFIGIVLAALIVVSPVIAAELNDVPGAADPDGLQRIAGAVIIGYDQSSFDENTFPEGPVTYDGAEKSLAVEGPRTRLVYVVPGDRSPLEVVRNYEAELTEKGFAVAYQCGKEACGKPGAMINLLYPLGGRLENMGQVTSYAFSSPRNDQRYLLAQNPETGRTVSVYAAFETFDNFPETADKVLVLVDVVDSKPMEQRMETVSAAEMALALSNKGAVSLYGILFEFDSDRLTVESDPTLEQIANLLNNEPDLRLFVVGHTDMTGGYEYNMDLSQRRAGAVAAALAERFGVSADRLAPAGVGPLAPVASNATEEGRAENRRVELVRR